MDATEISTRLNALLTAAEIEPLAAETAPRFASYLSLFIRWNRRLNLSAIREEEDILSRHFIESIAVARALPFSIRTLLDFGSGAGLPGIPIALCRAEIAVTLAESQTKKAAFLQEVVRAAGISAQVHADRAETLRAVFDCVTLRAVEKMPKAVAAAVKLLAPSGWLALMTTHRELAALQAVVYPNISWCKPVALPNSNDRIFVLGQQISPAA